MTSVRRHPPITSCLAVALLFALVPAGAFGGDLAALEVELIEITPELRQHLGSSPSAGLLVSRVQPGGAADRAGLEVGDVVTRVDDWSVDSVGDVYRRLRHYSAGEAVSVTYLRRGATAEAEIVPRRPPGDRRDWHGESHRVHHHSGHHWHADVEIDADELEERMERLGERLGRLGERLGRAVERAVDDVDWGELERDLDRLGWEIERSVDRSVRDLDRVTIEIDGEVLEADLDRLGRDIERLVEGIVGHIVDEVEYDRR